MSQGWEEFVKCLALYNQDIITRGEVYALVKELLRPHDPELIVWFRNFLGVDDSEPTEIGLNELDWSTATKLGPSYRALPDKVRPLASFSLGTLPVLIGSNTDADAA